MLVLVGHVWRYLRHMIELWGAIAVPLLTVVVAPVLRGEFGNRLGRRVSHHADIRAQVLDNPEALRLIDEVLVAELDKLHARETWRARRQIDGGSIAALFFVTSVGSAIVYGLLVAAGAVDNSLARWVLVGLACAVGAFTFGLSAVGATTIYKDPDKPRQPRKARQGSNAAHGNR